tara:strand:+ start:2253 stop:2507 length:255 start_codon:yes stop_codon:yes gene_type:complete
MNPHLIYNPATVVINLKKLGLIDHNNIQHAMDAAMERAELTSETHLEGHGFGSSDLFSEVISVARDLGFKFNGREFYRMETQKI